MNKKVKHGSVEELIALDARERRASGNRTSETWVVQHKGYREWLVNRMEEYDPRSEKARKLAKKYSIRKV